MERVRQPQAAIWGFYPLKTEALIETLRRCFRDSVWGPGAEPDRSSESGRVIGGVAPHAGYEYSGPCAAHLYKAIGESWRRVDTVVIMGSNHTGFGGAVTTTKHFTKWATPLGEVPVDTEFIDELMKAYPGLVDDPLAHTREHSVEVQLPFLQYVLESFSLVPVVVSHIDLPDARGFARAIASTSQRLGRRILVIASSDFTHHGSFYGYVLFRTNVSENVRKLDMEFIRTIEALDTQRFLNLIRRYDSTVCGYGAIAVAMEYARLVNASMRLLRYYNSGELTGDESMVVGYAAIAMERGGGHGSGEPARG